MLTAQTFKTWGPRLLVFALGAVAGTVAALCTLWAFVLVSGQVFMAAFVHFDLILPTALLCGTVVGIAAATGRTWSARTVLSGVGAEVR
ncbi:MAG: hypothetical protein JHC95_15235 [Solirubrobacteraceae bacterium]|nr:hypothetical protein [Solirubrobacteraceae bacterium]